MRLLERIGGWLATAYSASDQQLGLARVIFAGYMLFLVGLPSFTWMADAPAVLFNPPPLSFASLFDGWPDPIVLGALSLGVQLGFVLLLFGIATPVASVAVSVLMMAGLNFSYSFGKIDHNILLALAPLIMSFSGWGNRYALFPKHALESRERNAVALGMLALIIGFGMLTAAVPKLRSGWLELDTQAVFAWMMNYNYGDARHELLTGLPFVLNVPWLWELADWTVVAFEGLFLASVRWPRAFRTFLFVAVQFHVANLLLLNIAFAFNLAVYAVFVDWRPTMGRVAWHPSARARWLVLGATTAVACVAWWLGSRMPEIGVRVTPSLHNVLVALSPGEATNMMISLLPMGLAWVAAAVVAAMALREHRSGTSAHGAPSNRPVRSSINSRP